MGIGDEEGGDDVLFLRLHARNTFAAAALAAEIDQWGAFDIATGGYGHDHILARDQVFVVHVAGPVDDLCAARHGKLVFHFGQLVRDDAHDPFAAAQNFKVFLDLLGQFFQLVGDLFHPDLCQTLQTQFQNGAGLCFGQVIGAVVIGGMCRIVDQCDILQDLFRGPTAGHQLFARFSGIGGGPDRRDDLVDIGNGHGQTTQDVAAFTRLAQQIGSAAGDDIFAEIDEGCQELAQGQLFGPAAVERQHVTAEIGLHRGETVKLVHHHFGGGVALQLDHNPHAVAVRFILNMGDAVDLLLAHLLGDLFDHGGFIHLIANLVDDDGETVFANLFDTSLGPHDHTATPLKIGFARARTTQHDPAGGEVGAGDIFDQLFRGQIGVLDQGLTGVDHFAQVVRRDVGRHTNGDTARAIDQHIRETCRQNCRFAFFAIVVVDEINGFLVQIAGHEGRDLIKARFRITHRRSAIAVHRPKVTLTVNQRQRHREVLRHADQSVIDRAVPMRVIGTHHVAHGLRRLAVGFFVGDAFFIHRIDDAAVNRFQPVSQVGNGARNDDRHGVIQIGCPHLVFDIDRRAIIHGARSRDFVIVFRGFWRVVHVICLALAGSISCGFV